MGGNNSSPSKEKTSFLKAVRSGKLLGVQDFLNQGGDVDVAYEPGLCRTCSETTLLVFPRGGSIVFQNGLTALHFACKGGYLDIVNELLNRGASVDAATTKGNTALHIACLAGHLEVVRVLLQYRATVNVQSTKTCFTPLYMAAQEGHTEIVKLLLCNGADQKIPTSDGFTALAVALQQNHREVVEVLLAADSNSTFKSGKEKE